MVAENLFKIILPMGLMFYFYFLMVITNTINSKSYVEFKEKFNKLSIGYLYTET